MSTETPVNGPAENAANLRRRIEAQGYRGFDDADLARLDPWLRFVPFVTALVAALGTLMAAPAVLAVLTAVTALGAATSRHPLERAYNRFIRPLEASVSLPVTPPPRRAAYAVWTLLLAVTTACLYWGATRAGTALGWCGAAFVGWTAAQQQCLVSEALFRLFSRGPDRT